MSLKFIDLFAGIGGIRLGFEEVGYKCVFSSEWDKFAAQTYEANFNEVPEGDITEIPVNEIPDHDILLAGFPCQPFSIIGDKDGFEHETQGTLFFNIEKILEAKKPKAFMLENVRNLVSHDKGRTFKIIVSQLEKLGYKVFQKVLNALDFGVPQKRQRIIIVGFLEDVDFNFPTPIEESKRKTLEDIIDFEANLDKRLQVKDYIYHRRMNKMNVKPEGLYITHENVSGSVTPHEYSCALRAGASSNYLLVNNKRRLSEREMLRLQGFPEEFKVVVSYTQMKKQIGNSVAVPVIKAVAKEMEKTLNKHKEEALKAMEL